MASETIPGTDGESAGEQSRGSIFHFEFQDLTKKMMSMTPTCTANAIRTVAASGFQFMVHCIMWRRRDDACKWNHPHVPLSRSRPLRTMSRQAGPVWRETMGIATSACQKVPGVGGVLESDHEPATTSMSRTNSTPSNASSNGVFAIVNSPFTIDGLGPGRIQKRPNHQSVSAAGKSFH